MSYLRVRAAFETVAMQIRPYQDHDEAAVSALWEHCGLTRPWNDPRTDIARTLGVQREGFLVAVDTDGHRVGTVMAGYDGHRGGVHDLAVASSCRSRGLGRRLMAAVEQRLSAAGCPTLGLMVRSGNADALAFYRRLGDAQDDVVPLGKRLIADDPSG